MNNPLHHSIHSPYDCVQLSPTRGSAPSVQVLAAWQGTAKVKLGFSMVRSVPARRVGNSAGEDTVRALPVRRAPGTVQAHVAHRVSPMAGGPGVSAGPASLPGTGAGLPSGLSLDVAWNKGLADRGARTASHPDPPWPCFFPWGALPGCRRGTTQTEQGSHAPFSIQAPAARAHTALPLCRAG